MSLNDNITLNRIFDVLREIATRHKMLKASSVGDNATRGHDKDNDSVTPQPKELEFPYMFIDVINVGLDVGTGKSINAKNFTIKIFVADKHSDNSFNDQEILSDTEGILSDVIQTLLVNPDFRKFSTNIGIINQLPVRHATRDEVFGFEADLLIRVPYKFCHGALPVV